MYQALYRKWRPKVFDDVIGQEHITETLKNQIISGRYSHAYLFIGTRGTGKTTCAKILAKAVNCESPVNGNPCNRCAACRGIDSGEVMDVVELDAASNNGVDNVRALRDEAVFSPAQVKKRVYIVDEVHMLSTSAFNALLKILEEPPAHLMFILATTEQHRVPATILSRCQRFSFRRIEPRHIADRLGFVARQEGLNLTEDAQMLLARLADGSLRDGLSLLDQCAGADVIDARRVYDAVGLAGSERIIALLEAVAAGDSQKALAVFSALWTDGKNPATLLDELSVLMRDILMTAVAPRGGEALLSGGFDGGTLAALEKRIPGAALLRDLNVIQDALAAMREAVNPRMLAELCLIRLCEPELADGLPELSVRLARLEAAVVSGVLPAPTAAAAPAIPADAPPAEPEDRPPWEETAPAEVPETPAPPAPPAAKVQTSPAPETAPGSGEIWERILRELQGQIPVGCYSVISDPFHAEGSLTGNVLTIAVKSKFAQGMVDRPDVTDRIRAVGGALLGQAMAVRVTMADGGAKPDESKLAALGRFGNVKFE